MERGGKKVYGGDRHDIIVKEKRYGRNDFYGNDSVHKVLMDRYGDDIDQHPRINSFLSFIVVYDGLSREEGLS
jgi:hypothetical protein